MSTISMLPLEALASLVRGGSTAVRVHSGAVQPGDAFIALPGAVPVGPEGPDYTDAPKYLVAALQGGATHVVCTGAVRDAAAAALATAASLRDVTVTLVSDTRAALGVLAAARCGTETSRMKLIGITGTNGKTTETYLLEHLFRAAGHECGVIGTVEYRWPGFAEASPLTTPDCMRLHGMMADMERAGADVALMEVSSHAIEQNRIAGLDFAGALFTNLTQDHLDYHKDMEDYYGVKKRLFLDPAQGGVPHSGKALAVNVDDPYGARLVAACPSALGYGFGPAARSGAGRCLLGVLREQSQAGLQLSMTYEGTTWELQSPLVGEFNAANLLGAQAMALACGLAPKQMTALASFMGVPGRLERIANAQNLAVFVDYAHTPDALAKALQALRGAKFERIIAVFGCGGNRDRTKRPLMGKAVAALADVAVVTSDNPRREDPLAILDDIRPGLVGAQKVLEAVDRKTAIGLALNEMRQGDALLIAGKGHEPYQIVGDTRHPFSDQQVVKELLGCA